MRYGSAIRAGKLVLGSLVGVLLLLAVATGIGDVVIGWTNPPVGRFIDTTAGRQHVLDVGPEPGAPPAPPIVLLHGATANLGDMRVALVGRLRARHRVIAVDRPGHGWSERKDGAAEASPRRQAAVLHEILRKAGVERPVLVAHSWAGSVGLAYALDHPGGLRGLLLLAPLARSWHSGLRRYAELVDTPWLSGLLTHTVVMPVGLLALQRIAGLAFAPQAAPPDYVDRASILLALRPAAARANAQDLGDFNSLVAAQVARYPQIATPTVIMTGTDDRLVQPRFQARAIARQMPDAKLVVVPGVGHMLHHVRPDRVVAEIEALAKVDDSRYEEPAATRPR